MEISPTSLLRLLLASLVFGAIMGVLYDCIRIQRVLLGISRYTEAASAPIFCPKVWKNPKRRTPSRVCVIAKCGCLVFQDVAFCLTGSVLLSVLLFYQNNGEFRGFVLIGAAFGFLAYYFTVGKLVIRVSEYVVFAIKTALLYVVYYTMLPFIAAGRFLVTRVGHIAEELRRKKREKRILRHHAKVCEELLALSRNGFLGAQWAETEKSP